MKRLCVRNGKINVQNDTPRDVRRHVTASDLVRVRHGRTGSVNLAKDGRRLAVSHAGLIHAMVRCKVTRDVRLVLYRTKRLQDRALTSAHHGLFQVREFNGVVIHLRLRSLRTIDLITTIKGGGSRSVLIHLPSSFYRFGTVRPKRVSIGRSGIQFSGEGLIRNSGAVSNVNRFVALFLRRTFRGRKVLRIVIDGGGFR